MNRRKTLVHSVLGLMLIGILGALTPFVLSLSPNTHRNNILLTIDITELDNGQYLTFQHTSQNEFEQMYLVLLDYDSQLHVFSLPTQAGSVVMPDLNWSRPVALCNHFGPDLENTYLKVDGTIRCHDRNLPQWWQEEWQWDYSGTNLGEMVDNMEVPKYKIEADTILILRI